MVEKKNPHEGHRERMKQRYLSQGLDGFAEHEVLEMLLFYSVPRADTNELAHALLDRFSDLHGVLSAEPMELCQVSGVKCIRRSCSVWFRMFTAEVVWRRPKNRSVTAP